MLFISLTQVKDLTKILDVPRFWGPLATVAFLAIYHIGATHFGYELVPGWLWLALIAGCFIGGLRAGLLAAVLAGAYALYILPTGSLTFQRVIIGFLIALLVGYLRRRERRLEDVARALLANGNIDKTREALEIARRGKLLGGGLAGRYFEQIEDRLGNTLAVIGGYWFIREEIERVNDWYASPANARKLHKMMDEEAGP